MMKETMKMVQDDLFGECLGIFDENGKLVQKVFEDGMIDFCKDNDIITKTIFGNGKVEFYSEDGYYITKVINPDGYA